MNFCLNYKIIILTGSQIITSQITTGPLFSLGGIYFDLRFTGISLTENTGKGLISHQGKELTINSGTYQGINRLTTYYSLIIATNVALVIGDTSILRSADRKFWKLLEQP
ncbi:MAG: hypothetical protein EZS28_019712 [Streblomastix strix]|uniref:Uncharacterized protein n=1 Tax=Streblomastix strix TaxID=222440 RepID=A0A5J4VQJ0_9EUKA|nr:MAG: hypothetical protein EZS28_019712 [Streblomastix strix]